MPTQSKMVGWYDPKQLLQTAGDLVFSTLLNKHGDKRFLETLASRNSTIFDYSNKQDIVIDYVADTGDGWNSTYAIASTVAHPNLPIPNIGQKRADVLVFGGDQVYPVASRQEYEDRLVGPYTAALKQTVAPHPEVFAIPGNHDWYDSLRAFMHLFVAKQWFAGWRSRQERSYFALKLPHGWWLVGTDVALESDLDEEQLRYFQTVVAQMGPNDRVILCNAEPYWVTDSEYRGATDLQGSRNLRFLADDVFSGRVRVFVAGDLHHYRRHTSVQLVHKITAGGGGGFLHPTYGFKKDALNGGFKELGVYPSRGKCLQLNLGNLIFFLKNPKFGVMTAILYVMTAWSGMTDFGTQSFFEAFRAMPNHVLNTPAAAMWCLAVILGTIAMTDTSKKLWKWIGGGLHAFGHLGAVFVSGWIAAAVTIPWFPYGSVPQILLSGLIVFAGGWLLGSTVLGVYLFISLCLGRHRNEAFSSLAVEDWKNFLRFHITPQGALEIFAFGIDEVPKKWKANTPGASPEHVPDGNPIQVRLIDQPNPIP
jgi:hypothetical protein